MLKFGTFDLEPNMDNLIENMDYDNSDLTYDYQFLMMESKNPLKESRSTKEAKEKRKCYKWFRKRFQFLNLKCKPDIFYESSLQFNGNLPMKNGLSKDEKKIDLESFIMKSRSMTFIVIKVNGEDVCGKAFSPVMHYVFDRGRCNLEF